ncbi:MAG TPA: hemerythrin domain-containing protein [Burkholderiales bacterium]|jgi:hemerythrin superfamily protein|nr:hemerythrin domain-containing protein [Burkholderiales bacterium]
MTWQPIRKQALLFRGVAAVCAAVPTRHNRLPILFPGLSLIARAGYAGRSSAQRDFREARRRRGATAPSTAPRLPARRRSLFAIHLENFMNQPKPKSTDAVDLLTADHDKVKKLFKSFNKLKETGSPNEKSALVSQICNELTVHTKIEEEIFYPAAREAIKKKELIDEANVEHTSAKTMIEELQEMEAEEELYDAKVMVLGEYVNHHIKEEEEQIFPEVKKVKMDTVTLGERLSEMKTELMADVGEMSR